MRDNSEKALEDQKSFLLAAKKSLAGAGRSITWDQMATMVDLEPRALKTYRMPESSPDYRSMPRPVRKHIEALLQALSPSSAPTPPTTPTEVTRSPVYAAIAPAVAALVIRQAQLVMLDGRGTMVSGNDRRWGLTGGLDHEDRKAMALVSRGRLSLGLSDCGAEIHQLLALCTAPLANWLPLPEIEAAGLSGVRLIDPEERLPTIEAEELALNFSSLTGLFEEQVFSSFIEILAKQPPIEADRYYTRVREFAVRHPIASRQALAALYEEVPSSLSLCIQQGFYEPLPQADGKDSVQLCLHCGNLLRRSPSGLTCTTAACAAQNPTGAGRSELAEPLYRLKKGLRQYWLEPGIDEVIMHDRLVKAGLAPRLYPHRDRVDIDLGPGSPVGIDLKSYTSPELLGSKISQRPGGLVHYEKRWLVIPDWLVRRTPGYLERLSSALEGTAVRCLSVSTAIMELTRA